MAIIFITTTFVLQSVFIVFQTGVFDGAELKVLVGSQRIGFIYLLSFWISILDKKYLQSRYLKKMKWFFICISLLGLLLTFSRSSIVSLLISISIYSIYKIFKLSNISTKKIRKNLITIIIVIGTLIVIYPSLFVFTKFYTDRLFGLLFSGNLFKLLSLSNSSEGLRFIIWNDILSYLGNNPIFGSLYLGYWSLPGAVTGSSHNQYFDVLLKSGAIGFILYITCLVFLSKFLFKYWQNYFWGFISILVYGVFHETFKESQGAFIIAFMIGLYSSSTLSLIPGNYQLFGITK